MLGDADVIGLTDTMTVCLGQNHVGQVHVGQEPVGEVSLDCTHWLSPLGDIAVRVEIDMIESLLLRR